MRSQLRYRWLSTALFFAVAVICLASACDSNEPLREPEQPGPYGVGVTERTFTRPSTNTGEPRRLDTVVWYPTDSAGAVGAPERDADPASDGAPYPVVVFSHGSGGEPTHASYLTEHLASWGYVVIAPPHPGNTRQDGACDTACLAVSLVNRVPDITFALDGVLALDPNDPLAEIVDPERTAATGFSFGGMTAIRAIPEHRFDAIVAIAPAVATSLIDIARDIDVPVMLSSGGLDLAVPAGDVQQLYEALPAAIQRYLLYFPKARHTNFQDVCQEACELSPGRGQELLRRYITSFLEAHLLGDERYLPYLEQGEPPDLELTSGTS